MKSLLYYTIAAAAEILGCFSFWSWLRLDKSILYLIPGTVSLCLFAYLLTFIETDFSGRAYAAYGGVYIIASLLWMWVAEGNVPNKYDAIGGLVCLLGVVIILSGSQKISLEYWIYKS